MQKQRTYTINEAAALTGLHRNTIRQRVKLGQLKATVEHGKFGDEYRITPEALRAAGLLPETDPLYDTIEPESVLDAELTDEGAPPEGDDPQAQSADGSTPDAAFTALSELYQRHEQAMFRLGYLQGELERLKVLEATAESLRHDGAERQREVERLRAELAEKERRAAEAETLRQELREAEERLREMETLRHDLNLLKLAAEERHRRPWWQFWKG